NLASNSEAKLAVLLFQPSIIADYACALVNDHKQIQINFGHNHRKQLLLDCGRVRSEKHNVKQVALQRNVERNYYRKKWSAKSSVFLGHLGDVHHDSVQVVKLR